RDSSHSRSALSSALQVVPTVPVAEPRWAWVLVELAIAYWRAHGWPQVDATPNAGRTETVSRDHLPETSAWLARLLEVEPVATEEPGMTDGRKDGSEPGRALVTSSSGIPAEGLDCANAEDDRSPQGQG